MTFIRKYFEFPSGRREWAVTGEFGSLSFWCSPTQEDTSGFFDGEFYGGVETHYNEQSKPAYLDDKSKHNDCHVNGGECWHDGTSLWASEYWIPSVLPRGDKCIWETLEYNYDLKDSSVGETE
jgi:hypothetical protein